jgi:tetratricopeptide (TPR) repeat protein
VAAIADYRDFELAVSADGDKIFAQVNCPAGESDRIAIKLPFNPESTVLRIENAILRSVNRLRSAGRLESDLRKIGEGLFRSLLLDSNQIQRLYTSSRDALPEGARLRLKLRVDTDSLAALPWEYFYDNLVVRDYLGLHAQTSLVRYTGMQAPIRELAVEGPLRILGMVSNPKGGGDFDALDVTTERARIDKAIRSLHESGAIDFQWVFGESAADLSEALTLRGPWHAFHFIGHGGVDTESNEGFVVMADEYGEPHYIPGADLKRVLAIQPSLRLVVLNCCDSGRGPASVAKKLVTGGVPAVLAMQYPISDVAAIEMSSGFYTALAGGESVDGAVSSARIRMKLKSSTEWGIPILHMRSPDGKLFARPGTRAAAQPEPAAPAIAAFAAVPAAAPVAPVAPPAAAGDGFDTLLDAADARDAEFAAALAGDESFAAWPLERLVLLAEYGEREKTVTADVKLRKRLAAAHFQMGALYRKENANKAFVALTTAIKLDPAEPNYPYTRANLFARGDQLDLAMADMDKALELAPGRAEYHWAKGLLCLLGARNGANPERLKDAVTACDTAIKLQPGVGSYYSTRGAAQHKLGNLAEAMHDLDTALKLDQSDAKSYYHRAQLKQQSGDLAGAEADLQAATRLGHPLASRELQKLEAQRETRH